FVKSADLIHWEKVSELNNIPYTNLENSYDQGIFYIFSKDNGTANLYYSLDAGVNWNKLDNTKLPAGAKSFIVINHNLFIASTNTVFKSTDLGASWNISKNTASEIRGITSSGSGKIIAVTTTEILISEDNGVNWNSKSLPYPLNSSLDYFKLFSNSAGIFISVEINGQYLFYRTKDDGQSWQNVSLVNGFDNVSSIVCNNNGWWAISSKYTYQSINEGKDWGKEFFVTLDPKIVNSNDTLYCSGFFGFFKSYNNGQTWKSGNVDWDKVYPGFKNRSLEITEVFRSFDFYNDQLYCSNYGSIYSTDVNGDEWILYNNSGLGPEMYNFFAKDDTIGFYGNNGYLSKDKGKNWTKIITPFGQEDDPYNKVGSLFTQVGNTLINKNQESDYLFISNDWGKTWNKTLFFLNLKYDLSGSGNKLFVSTDNGIYSSSDYGSSFNPDFQGIGGIPIDKFYSSGNELFCIYDLRLYKLINNVWTLSDVGLDKFKVDFNINKIAANDELVIASCDGKQGADYKKIYYSKDGGHSWNGALSDIFPNIDIFINHCTLNHKNIYLSGTDNFFKLRVFKIDLESVGVSSVTNETEINVFPNPNKGKFNIKTTRQSGSWKIYNLLGSMIKEGNTQDTEIDLSAYPEGMYFVSIGGNENKVTKSLIIQRR
ncbi:MAG TPA: T9SS type A sorting domain-containing protein, partial [Saprospiraceae bacterium]|nr:T9SS type A sorting domain-containing protein [Saprospiraceae bacterium]